MRSTSIIIGLFLTITSLFAQDEPKSQIRNIGSFENIQAGKGINVTLIEGSKERLEINIKNGELSDVLTDLKGKTLKIRLKTKIYKDLAVQVYVTYKTLNEISTGTGAFIESSNIVRADKLTLNAGTGSTIILDVDAKSIYATMSSSKIELVGKTDYQEVSAHTGSKYIGEKLASKEAYAKASTGASVWINVSDKLEAKGNTGGKIMCKGNPKQLISNGNVTLE